MFSGLRQKVVVQPGGKQRVAGVPPVVATANPKGVVELCSPELPAGATVEVIVLLEPQPEESNKPLASFIGAAKGNFASPEEVDQFIRQERDAWQS